MKIVITNLLDQFPGLEFHGNEDAVIDCIVGLKESLDVPNTAAISWLSDKISEKIDPRQLQLGLLILSPGVYEKFKNAKCNFLISENPRSTFATILSLYFKKTWPCKTEASAFVHPTSHIGSNCYIGHNVVVDEDCVIGNDTVILHNTSILANTSIGNHVFIGCNNTIGNYGFGYEKDAEDDYQLLEHLGKVVIHDNVEIHNNTCIDRGVLTNTEIHDNVKIDNLVHIAHGVVIERNSLIIANAMIAGSAHIGQNTWIAPSVSVKNQVQIADNTNTGIGAVILKNTQENSLMIGNPATTMDDYRKWSELRKRLLSQ